MSLRNGGGPDGVIGATETGRVVELGSVNTRPISRKPRPTARTVFGGVCPGSRNRPMIDPVVIVVALVGRRGRFRAEIAGRVIVASSKQPVLDGARVLISEGYAPDIVLEMWHANATAFALRSTIGAAGKLTVDDSGTPRFRRWKPFLPREGSLPIAPSEVLAIPDTPSALAAPKASLYPETDGAVP
jgi:hypothetical protein